MGQKTNPIGLRVGVIRGWDSKWFTDRNFADLLHEDLSIRQYVNKRLDNAGISKFEIMRAPKRITVDIHTSRPGIVIGRKGVEVDKLREELQLLSKKEVTINIIEVKRPELEARLVAEGIARQLEGRINFRRAMKKSLAATMKMGAEGIKIVCGGRLGGAEIARVEKYMAGRVPLHTLRANIDFARATAHTTYGTIGVKVWICRGMVLAPHEEPGDEQADTAPSAKTDKPKPRRRRGARSRRKRPAGEKPHGKKATPRADSGERKSSG
jgi:small subunit ribosomal protein S3